MTRSILTFPQLSWYLAVWEDEKGRRQERCGREKQLATPYETGSTEG
jgi:hypothetical protein